MKRLFTAVASLSLLFTGCAGYHIGATKPKFMTGIHSLAVPTFENTTLLPRVEVLAATTVIKQLQQDGTFQVASSDKADAILKGTLTRARRSQARSVRSDVEASQEYILEVEFTYQLTRRSTGELLDAGKVAGTTSFYISGNDVNQDERQAFPLALEQAAIHLVSRVTEGW